MEYLILALIVFVFVRYVVPMLDVLKEYFDMIIASKVNNININIATKTHEFKKACEDLDVEVDQDMELIGFRLPESDDECSEDDEYEEDDEDEDE